MDKAIGIDLGTTNSVGAFKKALVEVVTADGNTPPGRKLTRSVVAYEQSNLLVGEKAYNQLRADPEYRNKSLNLVTRLPSRRRVQTTALLFG